MITYEDLIGVPFKVHGRDKNGMDCWGLAVEIYRRIGKKLPDVFYVDHNDKEAVRKEIEMYTSSELIDRPEEYCLVNIVSRGTPTHIGVYLGEGMFIHAVEKNGVVVEPLHRYKNRIRGYYRVSNT